MRKVTTMRPVPSVTKARLLMKHWKKSCAVSRHFSSSGRLVAPRAMLGVMGKGYRGVDRWQEI